MLELPVGAVAAALPETTVKTRAPVDRQSGVHDAHVRLRVEFDVVFELAAVCSRRRVADVDLEVTNRKITLGFLVATSIDYMIFDYLSARLEMKFRNPQYNVTSKYSKTEANYNGTPVPLLETPFETKVDINGVTFVFGVVFQI